MHDSRELLLFKQINGQVVGRVQAGRHFHTTKEKIVAMVDSPSIMCVISELIRHLWVDIGFRFVDRGLLGVETSDKRFRLKKVKEGSEEENVKSLTHLNRRRRPLMEPQTLFV